MINIGEWTDFEMGKGIPQYSKVFLQMKRPPLVIEFKYTNPETRLKVYGSFKNEEPNAKDNFLAMEGRFGKIKVDPTRGKGKSFGMLNWFYFSLEGPDQIKIRCKFQNNLN